MSYGDFLLKKKLNSINCNKSLIKFQDFLNKELNKIIPEKNPSVRNKRNWIDNEVKNAATKKHHLRQLYLKERSSSAKAKYENQSKLVKKLVRKKMRQYYQTKINKKAGQNTRNFFDAVKEIMGESKNLEIKEVESKLKSFNNFFAEGKNLQKILVLNAMSPTQRKLSTVYFSKKLQ